MTDNSRTAPNIRDAAAQARIAREAREAEALRANLRRRKEQARARAASPPEPWSGEAIAPSDSVS